MNPILTFFGGVILTIILGILANLATPKTQSLFQKWSLSTKGKRLAQLKKEYAYVEILRESHATAMMLLLSRLTVGLLGLGFVVMSIYLQTSLSLSGDWAILWKAIGLLTNLFMGLLGIWQLLSLLRDITRAMDFDNYKKQVLAQVEKLGAKPEELLSDRSK